MNAIVKNEILFEKIRTIEDLLEAERSGFTIHFKTTRPEMPGATILHEACRCCYLELIKFLVEERGGDLSLRDEDDCTPLGYIVNDDVMADFLSSGEYLTVNIGCDDRSQIISVMEYLIEINAPCVYCERQYSLKYVMDCLEKLKTKRDKSIL
jgi:hypothetical protein